MTSLRMGMLKVVTAPVSCTWLGGAPAMYLPLWVTATCKVTGVVSGGVAVMAKGAWMPSASVTALSTAAMLMIDWSLSRMATVTEAASAEASW